MLALSWLYGPGSNFFQGAEGFIDCFRVRKLSRQIGGDQDDICALLHALKCLPRTPLLKSRVGRGDRGSSSLVFFILFNLRCDREAGSNKTDSRFGFSVNDEENAVFGGHADGDETVLVDRVLIAGNVELMVVENCDCFGKRDTMLLEIAGGFGWIELEYLASLCHAVGFTTIPYKFVPSVLLGRRCRATSPAHSSTRTSSSPRPTRRHLDGTRPCSFPPCDGQLRLDVYTDVSSGANMVEYWHWHSIHAGQETYWKGVLSHDLEPNRAYAEVSRIAHELQKIGPQLVNMTIRNDVAILYSPDSSNAISFMPTRPPS